MSSVDQIAELLTEKVVEQPTEKKQAAPEVAEDEDDIVNGEDTFNEGLEEVESNGESEDTAEEEDAAETDEEAVSWASVLGIDDNNVVLDDDGNLAGINVKVDGKVSTVGVADLIAGYQTNKHNTQKSQILAEERKQFDSLRQSVTDKYAVRIEALDKVTQYLHSQVMGEYNNVDWARLRQENPGEYAALQEDFRARQSQLQGIYASIEQEKGQIDQEASQETINVRAAFIQGEMEKVVADVNPEWSDINKLKQGYLQYREFAENEYGLSPTEFDNLVDHRLFKVLKDAMSFKQGLSVSKKKLEQPVPKFQKASGTTRKPASKLEKLTRAAKRATGTQQRRLQTDAITELLLGNE